jgi:small subunit ribosomal protein S16
MLMMRLQRVGRKNEPSYRVVVVDKRTGPKSNKNIDQLGFYNPKLGVIEIDGVKAKQWLSQGVQPSDTVHNMLVTKKIIDAKKINVLPKKTPIIKETPAAQAAPATEEAATEAPKEEVTA